MVCQICGDPMEEDKVHHCQKPPLQDVAQQPHYTKFKIQPITFIEANKLSYSQGNVIKYVCRYKGKNGLEDLKKAKVYIDYLIQELETGEVNPNPIVVVHIGPGGGKAGQRA